MIQEASLSSAQDAAVLPDGTRQFRLGSGRRVRVHFDERDELVEIVEPDGNAVLTVRLTEDGPVVSIQGARLELRATESITMDSEEVRIRARKDAVVESDGALAIRSRGQMDVRSDDDVSVRGEMIYLNCDDEAAGAHPGQVPTKTL